MAQDRGVFIAVEGCDKSGKTEQCRRLTEALRSVHNICVAPLRFPNRETRIGKIISDYLKEKQDMEDHAIHLLFAANRWEAAAEIENLLKSQTTLVVDRYSSSGIAYSASKENMILNWCKTQDIGLPKPDGTIYLRRPMMDATDAHERYEMKDFQENIAKSFDSMRDNDWYTVDGTRSIEEVHREVVTIALKIIHASKQQCIKRIA